VDGVGPSFVPAVAFVPESLEIDPDEEGTLTLSLDLDPNKYDVNSLYSGVLLLKGSSDIPLRVELRVLATSPQSEQSNG
jgi:hypothetical protein